MSGPSWIKESVFYHIYPLGLCNATHENDFVSAPVSRLNLVNPWLEHAKEIGATAILLGPVFESVTHGYDVVDLGMLDRRLGTNEDLRVLIAKAHDLGLKVVIDAVYNHVGRRHFAFQDILEKGQSSKYVNWFKGLTFGRTSPKGDPFVYETWDGHWSLVKLDTNNSEVSEYLLGITKKWVEEFKIDGLRLDAADVLEIGFQRKLSRMLSKIAPDLWLMGEVVFDDYSRWARGPLHSATNYQLYKPLYSSHVDGNYFELIHGLDRQFGEYGIYKDLYLYNFVDNHDVARVASILKKPRHLYPLYLLLMTVPGVPSIYYGSEWGLLAQKGKYDDWNLRPALDFNVDRPHPDLELAIKRFINIRKKLPALREGGYKSLHVASEQLVFLRSHDQPVVIAVNSSDNNVSLPFDLWDKAYDVLNDETVYKGKLMIPANWGRVLLKS